MSIEETKAAASSDASAVVEHSDDDATKVFVSRLPLQWTDAHLKDHFTALFGPVTKATVRTDQTTGASRGFGFVVFEKESSQQAALTQKSFRVAHKTVMIRPLNRSDNDASNATEGATTKSQVCFSWSEGRCTRGDACKFEHSGPGACLETAAPGQGKPNKCRVFRRKGSCPAGDNCPFRHVRPSSSASTSSSLLTSKQGSADLLSVDGENKSNSDAAAGNAVLEKAVPLRKEKGICNTWRKKGKCRKGDRCPFGHPVKATAAAAFENDSSNQNNDSSGGANGSNSMKRRRIDGNTLVLAKKAMKRAQGQAGGGDDAITFLKE